jgi:hypothetical protein
LSRRGEGEGEDVVVVAGEEGELLAGLWVPEADGGVVGAGGQAGGVGGEGQGVDVGLVAGQGAEVVAGCGGPEVDGAMVPSREPEMKRLPSALKATG